MLVQPLPHPIEEPVLVDGTNGMSEFKQDLKELLRSALNRPSGRTGHMVKYLYSPVASAGSRDSGADMWNRVTMLGRDRYYIPQAEANVIDYNTQYLNNLFDQRPTVIDLGCGGYDAIMMKSQPTLKAVDAAAYVAFDINESYASNAAELVKRNMTGTSASFVFGDFTKPHKLKADIPTLITLYGCTLSQFPFSEGPNKGDEVTFGEVLQNIGEMVNFNAILIATIDTNQHAPSARDCYMGQHMDQFQRHFWSTAKTLIESNTDNSENYITMNYASVNGDIYANPTEAVVYNPRYKDGAVTHTFIVDVDMLKFVIDGESFEMPRGTKIDIGLSEKWSTEAVMDKAKKTGWSLINELTDGKSTVRALVLAGKNVSKAQKDRARRNLGQSNRETHAAASRPMGRLSVPASTIDTFIPRGPFSIPVAIHG